MIDPKRQRQPVSKTKPTMQKQNAKPS